ncbi:MAG: site-specific integrase [Nitrospiraceae bacterium]
MTRTATVSPIRPVRLKADAWQGFTSFASPNLTDATYEAECLAGHCFPRPGDVDMLRRCRDAYRIEQWLELFRRFHMIGYATPSNDTCAFNRYFSPLLTVRPQDLTRPVVVQWYHEIGRHSHAQANKSLALLRGLYNRAEEWQLWEGVNPATRIRCYKKDSRTRFVQPEEMPRLLESLARESLATQALFLTCLLTGCRGGEARAMKWEDLNLLQAVWTMPTSKNGTSHKVPLPPQLVGLLCRFPQTASWVFGAPRGGPIKKVTCFQNWRRIRERAGLPDVTIHDLRRTCASWMACNGENLAVISRVLNHSSLAITGVYARLDVSSMKTALGANANRMLGVSSAPGAGTAPPVAPVTTREPVTLQLHPVSTAEEREEWPG